jgi:AraC family transcriptional regulator
MKTYNRIKEILTLIESDETDKMSIKMLSRQLHLSGSHLQLLFKITTRQPLMEYIRGRKLAHSLDNLFNTDMQIIHIANEYGFQHEQSFIRAFIKEFGCTPGKARKTKMILPIRQRINPEDLHSFEKGFIYGPEIVMVPSFNIIGKPHMLLGFYNEKKGLSPNKLAKSFFDKGVGHIQNVITPVIYVGFASEFKKIDNVESKEYMPSVLVTDLSYVPEGFKGVAVPTNQYLRFRYIGEHDPLEINKATAGKTFDEIDSFFAKQSRYEEKGYYIEWLDTSLTNEDYCKMEWLIPVKDTLE